MSIGDHAESVEIHYDPKVTDYPTLLSMFWKNHEPTVQRKPQYMSAIFYHDNEQKEWAETTRAEEESIRNKKIYTKIVPASTFYDAEGYHQKYILQQKSALCKSLKASGLKDFKTSHVATRLNGYVAGYGTLEDFLDESTKLGLTAEQVGMVKPCVR
ncbi:peptide methionine sulfoxide reductase-like [Ornithodoros turicata]|uniref:peptide methionine sulfoxide reductase-like n=1 Tax=Ornithodoros turicata TaxID=34597 RepID=UPI003138DA1D